MSTAQPNNPGSNPNPGAFSQDIQYSQVTARVPEKVARGVSATGAIVLQGSHEFMLDFLQRVTQPHQLVARVILPFGLMPNFIAALQENLDNYTQRFGPPPALPPLPPNMPVPKVDEIYEQIKLPEDVIGGNYANAVMIVHTPAEFCFDFIANAYPRSTVSARVYMSSFHVPRMLDSLKRSFEQFQKKLSAPKPPTPPAPEPPK